MRVSVDFQGEQLDLELPGESLVGAWKGPEGMSPAATAAACAEVLEHPLDFPPFRQMVVPGDRVVIALDPTAPDAATVLGAISDVLAHHGVLLEDSAVVTPRDEGCEPGRDVPPGLACEVHDAADSTHLAYLATTGSGRRIYLNRRLTDADVVIPVGRLGYDPILGYRGPWSLLFPALSDLQTQADHRTMLADDPHGRAVPRTRLDEAVEVSWLLGTQFQVGLVPGASGVAGVVAGLSDAVSERGIREVDRLWSFRPPTRSECVVVGVGAAGREADIADLVAGLVTASRVVQHGGRIVALSRVKGPLGTSLQRLLDTGDPKEMAAALRGHERDPDSITGQQLARVLGWADVYLLSGLDRQTAEDLSMIPLDHPEDARRLVARSGSCTIIGRSEWTRATAQDEESH